MNRERIDVEGGYLAYDAGTKLYHVYEQTKPQDDESNEAHYDYVGCTLERNEAIAMLHE